jgi:hypothetical protein
LTVLWNNRQQLYRGEVRLLVETSALRRHESNPLLVEVYLLADGVAETAAARMHAKPGRHLSSWKQRLLDAEMGMLGDVDAALKVLGGRRLEGGKEVFTGEVTINLKTFRDGLADVRRLKQRGKAAK